MGYRYVVELETIRKVPDHYARCEQCGKWYGTEEFRNEGETANSRTNCIRCYEAGFEVTKDLESAVDMVHKGSKHFKAELQADRLNSCVRNGITVRDLIKLLREYPYDALVLVGDYDEIDIERIDEVSGEIEAYSLDG
jgi:hypothetical protein